MKTKMVRLNTKRLVLQTMTIEELADLIEKTEDAELKQAYTEMLELAKANENTIEWCIPWKITVKKTGEIIGDIVFKGAPKDSAVEIGYGIKKEYEGNGYTTEAAKAMIDWAFSKQDVMVVEAETAPDNKASQRILEKLSFEPDGEGKEGPRYMLVKPKTSYVAIFMCFGLSIGMAIGLSLDDQALGMCLGIAVGVGIGGLLDQSENKKRQEIISKRKDKRKE